MAEGLLKGLMGSEADAEVEDLAAESAVVTDQTATTLALTRGRRSSKAEQATIDFLHDQREFLKRQGRMLEIQMEHLHEQRALNLRHLRFRRWRESLQLGFQLFLTLAGTVIGLGVAIMLYDAFTSRAVVVDAFEAPPTLLARGLSGKVVATGVLDTLQKLQDATRAVSKGLHSQGAWASDVKIEVPETGVSVGEISRLLHERFGHDVHIGGDLVETEGGGLALTVRGDGAPAKTFTGAAGDLDRLTTAAAEYVYGRSQPLNYATYLEQTDRNGEAVDFLRGAFGRATSDEERARLATSWGNAYAGMNQPRTAIAMYRLAMGQAERFSTTWWKAWNNLVGNTETAAGEEAAWRESRAFLQAAAAAPARRRPEPRFFANPAQITWDLPLLLKAELADAAHAGGGGFTTILEGPTIAETYAQLHDPAATARYMAASDPADSVTKAETQLLQGYAALERGDAAAAIPPLEAFYAAWLADPNLQYAYIDNPCFLGLAYGLAGRMAKAEAVFARTGPWSRCAALHGDALAETGDVAGAQRVWAEGLKAAPDLPMVYLHRGLSALSRGDLAGAGADFAAAHARAPHFADPLKAWGDLLAHEGRRKLALAKYDEALRDAPDWAELRQARAAVAGSGR